MLKRAFEKATARTRQSLAALALAALALLGGASAARAASTPTPRAHLTIPIGFRGIAVITDLHVSSGPLGGQITLQWTAPASNGAVNPLSYLVKASDTGNIQTDPAFTAALPLSAFSPATPPPAGPAGTQQSMIVTGLTPDVVYCFAVKTQDSSFPTPFRSGWFRSVPKNINVPNCIAAANVQPPQAPMGVRISTNGALADISWLPVHRYQNGSYFINYYAPQTYELTGYLIYRATQPVSASWQIIGSVSTATWTFQDTSAAPGYFYSVRALNTNGASKNIFIRAYTGEAYAVGYDDLSTMMIPESMVTPLLGVQGTPGDPETAFLIDSSSTTGDVGGRVLKSINFKPLKGGATYMTNVMLPGPATIKIRYEQTASSVTPSGLGVASLGASGLGTSAAKPHPENLSVFWYNGSKWLQLFGHLSTTDQTMMVETPYFGQYQVRFGERLGAFNFNGAGITNRMITPNGDGKNDDTVFLFDNPQGSQVSVKIFDLKGKLVTTVTKVSPLMPTNSVVWDGTAGGVVVPSGVYIYQIGAEGKAFTGTIVVIK